MEGPEEELEQYRLYFELLNRARRFATLRGFVFLLLQTAFQRQLVTLHQGEITLFCSTEVRDILRSGRGDAQLELRKAYTKALIAQRWPEPFVEQEDFEYNIVPQAKVFRAAVAEGAVQSAAYLEAKIMSFLVCPVQAVSLANFLTTVGWEVAQHYRYQGIGLYAFGQPLASVPEVTTRYEFERSQLLVQIALGSARMVVLQGYQQIQRSTVAYSPVVRQSPGVSTWPEPTIHGPGAWAAWH